MGEAPFLKVSCATTTPEAPFLRSVGEGNFFLKGAASVAPTKLLITVYFPSADAKVRGENRKTCNVTQNPLRFPKFSSPAAGKKAWFLTGEE